MSENPSTAFKSNESGRPASGPRLFMGRQRDSAAPDASLADPPPSDEQGASVAHRKRSLSAGSSSQRAPRGFQASKPTSRSRGVPFLSPRLHDAAQRPLDEMIAFEAVSSDNGTTTSDNGTNLSESDASMDDEATTALKDSEQSEGRTRRKGVSTNSTADASTINHKRPRSVATQRPLISTSPDLPSSARSVDNPPQTIRERSQGSRPKPLPRINKAISFDREASPRGDQTPQRATVATIPGRSDSKGVSRPKEVIRTALKRGNLLVNGKQALCELLDSLEFVWYLNEDGTAAGAIDVRFKLIKVPDGALLKRLCTPFQILTESKTSLVSLQASTFDEMEEWIFLLEGTALTFINRAVDNILTLKNDWLHHRVRLWVGSWNVGNSVPGNLSAWLPCGAEYDIVVVGSQECTYKSRLEQNNSEDWFDRVKSTMGTGYVAVSALSLWEIRNIVLVKRKYAQFISDIRTHTVATGIANALGNKGGVAIAFKFHDTSFCFLTAHFAAHQDEIAARNANFREIIRRLKLDDSRIDVTNKYEHVFWYGDLNYRLALPFDTVCDTCYNGHEMELLYGADQLRNAMFELAKHVFEGFRELDPTFWPTYRYIRQVYDVQGNRIFNDEKLRIPSWTDRILWKSFPGSSAVPGEYRSVPSVDTSDHIPIWMDFEVDTAISSSLLNSSLSSKTSVVTGTLELRDLKAIGVKWSDKFSRGIVEDLAPLKKSNDASKKRKASKSAKSLLVNPAVIFHATFLSAQVTNMTSAEQITDTPIWGDYDLPVVGVTSSSYLETTHLLCEVVSVDMHSGKHTALGQVPVSLHGVTGTHAKRFNEPIMLNGETVAYIAGSLHYTKLQS